MPLRGQFVNKTFTKPSSTANVALITSLVNRTESADSAVCISLKNSLAIIGLARNEHDHLRDFTDGVAKATGCARFPGAN